LDKLVQTYPYNTLIDVKNQYQYFIQLEAKRKNVEAVLNFVKGYEIWVNQKIVFYYLHFSSAETLPIKIPNAGKQN